MTTLVAVGGVLLVVVTVLIAYARTSEPITDETDEDRQDRSAW